MESPRKKVIEFANKIELINPSDEVILPWIEDKILENNQNQMMFKANITSRSAAFTDVIDDGTDDTGKFAEIDNLLDFVNPEDFIAMTFGIGSEEGISLKATTLLPKSHANKAMMLRRNFIASDHDIEESDIISFDVPTYPKRRVIVDPRPGERITYVMGIDYYGEQKMSILRMVMEIQRTDNNGLGLHSGSKIYKVEGDNQDTQGVMIFGLSGTGKTTLTLHDHGFEEPEGVEMLQDDICLIDENGNVFGTEYGFYVKTDQCPEHELITEAVLSEGSILENVAVDPDGEIAWKDFSHTHNARAIVPREKMAAAGELIDLPKLDFILYNTRRPELPPIGRLVSPAQSAAYYALGESIITSAEDPARAGESKRQVGFDPFILGNESLNINRLKGILSKNSNVRCYVVNTGYVGEEENDIRVEDTLACIEGVLRNNIEWEFDEDIGYEVPKDIPGIELDKFRPREYYGDEKYSEMMAALREERTEYLNQFEGIEEDILNSI